MEICSGLASTICTGDNNPTNPTKIIYIYKIVFWEFFKDENERIHYNIYSRKKAKVRRVEIELLEKQIKDLEGELLVGPTKYIVDCIEEKRDKLNKLFDFSRQGIKIRSRAAWFEDVENNMQYFEQLLKSNKRKIVIREVYKENGETTRDKEDIFKEIKLFYKDLYSYKSKRLFLFNDISKLNQDNRETCEGKLSKDECLKVLKEMKLNKTPRHDGLTVEFYNIFGQLRVICSRSIE